MMIKQTLYDKTKRIGNEKIVITEKLDGSNLGFFKFEDELYIAQRNNIIPLSEYKDVSYKGLIAWLDINGQELKESLNNNSCVFGEWIGMGRLKYPDMIHTFQMFCKANISKEDNKFVVGKKVYIHDYFMYPFVNQEIPSFINIVPVVAEVNQAPISYLNDLYTEYTNKVNRNVEGFVVSYGIMVKKYVRMKSGKLEPHRS